MNSQEMQVRTRQFALRIIRLASSLPKGRLGDVLGRQLLEAGTSIGANYAEASGASSRKHFISLVEIAAREARETLYWLDLLVDSKTFSQDKLAPLCAECNELVAILTAMGKTAKRRKDE